MYICIYVSLCNPLATGDRLGMHKTLRRRSMTTCGLLLCFQGMSCVVGIDFIFKLYSSFLLKVDPD